METKGYVYILTNPCFKENWVKIGQTDNLERRIMELSQATGIPLPFEMYAVLKTTKYKQAETMIHRLVGKLAPDKRINPKREFFNIEPEDAVSIMKDIAGLLEDAEIIYNNHHTSEQATPKQQGKKSKFKTFYSMGIKDGDTIEFTLDPQYKATVCGERTVMFENKKYFLTPLGVVLLQRIGKSEEYARSLGSGFEVFKFDNQDNNLYARWQRLNAETK